MDNNNMQVALQLDHSFQQESIEIPSIVDCTSCEMKYTPYEVTYHKAPYLDRSIIESFFLVRRAQIQKCSLCKLI